MAEDPLVPIQPRNQVRSGTSGGEAVLVGSLAYGHPKGGLEYCEHLQENVDILGGGSPSQTCLSSSLNFSLVAQSFDSVRRANPR